MERLPEVIHEFSEGRQPGGPLVRHLHVEGFLANK